jgi:ribosomal protein L2
MNGESALKSAIHNIEITLGRGGQLARAAGAVAKLIAKEGEISHIKITLWGGSLNIQKLLSNSQTSKECWGEPEKFG